MRISSETWVEVNWEPVAVFEGPAERSRLWLAEGELESQLSLCDCREGCCRYQGGRGLLVVSVWGEQV